MVPSSLPWLLETPQAGDEGFGQSSPRLGTKGWDVGISAAVPPSLKVQVSAPWPPFSASVEELGAGIPSFTNHAGMDLKNKTKQKTTSLSSSKSCKGE